MPNSEVERSAVEIVLEITDSEFLRDSFGTDNLEMLRAEMAAAITAERAERDKLVQELESEVAIAKGNALAILAMKQASDDREEAAEAQVRELREALQVYANPENFAQGNDWYWVGDDDPTIAARAALSREPKP